MVSVESKSGFPEKQFIIARNVGIAIAVLATAFGHFGVATLSAIEAITAHAGAKLSGSKNR